MAIYYIESENGNILSANGERRFIRLAGKAAYDFLESEEGKGRRFMRTSSFEDGKDDEWVEVPLSCMQEHRKDERHEQYVSDCIEESGYTVISFYAAESDENSDVASGEELLGDPDCNVEEQALHSIDIEMLRVALKSLTAEEKWLIDRLYLSKSPITENQLSHELGVSQSTLNYQKRQVLNKLKNFF